MESNQSDSGLLKLIPANLESLAPRLLVPNYDRDKLVKSIVHFGVGGFHRAHQAVYLDELAGQNITFEWGEAGIGLLPIDQRMAQALIPQSGLYTVVERGYNSERGRIVGSLTEYVFGPDNPTRAMQLLTEAATKIVSLTITEGGYNIDNLSGRFKADNPAIVEDLANPNNPKTVFGYICEALDQRRKAGVKPFTVLSCDNLQGNGQVVKTAIVSFAQLRNESLAGWIEENVAFPNCMVDRITPQTTNEDRTLVAREFDLQDAWPVMTEPFSQWIVEDAFCDGRPPLEKVGVQFVSNVHPYETMKLRLLNASHQAMGYLGYLAGYRYIHEVMSDSDFIEFIARMMDDEVTPLLPPVPGIDLPEYKKTLIERFANPKIKDQVSRICTDGSDRMPKFLLPSLSQALNENRPHKLLTLAVAGWLRYLQGQDEQGVQINLIDPLAAELTTLANTGGADPRPLLSLHQVFGDLGKNEEFVTELSEILQKLSSEGTKATLPTYLAI